VNATAGGLLVNPDDPADLARGLIELITNPAQRFEFAQRGQQAVHSEYNTQKMADRTVEALS
jgi:glycosyltransferase involved in cell wall biosynthesis